MSKYRISDIQGCFHLFMDEEYEGESEIDVKEKIMCEIMDDIGNYIDIELLKLEDNEDEDEDYE